MGHDSQISSTYDIIVGSFNHFLKVPESYQIHSMNELNSKQVAVSCSNATVGLLNFNLNEDVPKMILLQVPGVITDA